MLELLDRDAAVSRVRPQVITRLFRALTDVETLKAIHRECSEDDRIILHEALAHDGRVPDEGYFRLRYRRELGPDCQWRMSLNRGRLGLLAYPLLSHAAPTEVIIPEEILRLLATFIQPAAPVALKKPERFPPYCYMPELEGLDDFVTVLDRAVEGLVRLDSTAGGLTPGSRKLLAPSMVIGEPLANVTHEGAGAGRSIRLQGIVDLLLMADVIHSHGRSAGPGARAGQFRAATPEERLGMLLEGWLQADAPDEITRLDGIVFGRHAMTKLTPRSQRATLLWEQLSRIQRSDWVSVDSFIRKCGLKHRDLLRPMSWISIGALTIGAESEFEWQKRTGEDRWMAVEGEYIKAVLFGCLAAMGIVNIAYDIATDAGMKFLSRYQTMRSFQLTAVGQFLLGRTDSLEPVGAVNQFSLHFSNGTLVVESGRLAAADMVFLNRIARRQGDSGESYEIDPDSIALARNDGISIAQIRSFLDRLMRPPLPGALSLLLDTWRESHEPLQMRPAILVTAHSEAVLAQLLESGLQEASIIRVDERRILVPTELVEYIERFCDQHKLFLESGWRR
ncbi:helicase-associated domain-containing protein [bacterium]|nr:helicase-associated domain-containing protein [candidate division CSSED10-310 bacterium]